MHMGGELSRQIKDLELSSSGNTQLVLWLCEAALDAVVNESLCIDALVDVRFIGDS
jgi:hypothetical protein